MKTGDIWLAQLDPTVVSEMGSQVQKTRPCVVLSPDDINADLRTVIVAPLPAAHQKETSPPTPPGTLAPAGAPG